MIRRKTYKKYELNAKPMKFIRDGRSPIPKNELTSKLMSANKAKNTKPEVAIRKALWQNGIRGYRLHWKNAPGKPDITFPGKKIAVFVNGCFWHRCPYCDLQIPRSNSKFWKEKFRKNVIRDGDKIHLLDKANWRTLVIWECEIKEDINSCLKKIKKILKK
jgi:DNA mismatch endonuclease (patch repair protein)